MASSASSVRSRAQSPPKPALKKLFGAETPRIFTPPLRKLTPRTSLGFSVINFARDVLGISLFPWQQWLLIHMLELLPDNSLRFRTVVVLVGRQNGKSTLSLVLALWFMYVYGVGTVLGTAQDLDVAEEIWQGAVDLVEELDENDEPVRPELYALLSNVVRVNGKKAMVLKPPEDRPENWPRSQRYKVKAANRRAGRGLSGDLVLLDELREHQSWDAWGALTKTTMARAHALILALSNAGDATSIVLRHLRKMAHAALGDPDGICDEEAPEIEPEEDDLEDLGEDTLGLFEWSAKPGCAVTNRDGWAQANPSLGHNPEFTERTVASACKTDTEWVFRTEVLCQWSDGSLEGPFPPGSWEDCLDTKSKVGSGEVGLCVAMSWDRSRTHVGLAGWRPDGVPHIEVIASRLGSDWVAGWLTSPQRQDRVRKAKVAIQASGSPEASLIGDLKAAGVDVEEWKGAELGKATGAFYDRVREGTLRHRTHPVLDVAAATAVTKPTVDAYLWDVKRSPHDAAPLKAVTGALWLILPKDAPQTPPGAPAVAETREPSYETADLMTAGF